MLLRIIASRRAARRSTAPSRSQLGEGLAQIVGEEQFAAYLASLKQKAKVKLNKEQFETQAVSADRALE